MTTNEMLSLHQPEDILGYIPHVLGYWPTDSLVAITMQGKVLGATLRVDLPDTRSKRVLSRFAAHVRSYLLEDDAADGVVLAVYTDRGWEDATVGEKTLPLLVALQEALDAADLAVRDAWLIGSKYWRSAFCPDGACCPFPGLPVEMIQNSPLSAEMVFRGSSFGRSPRDPVPATEGSPHPVPDPAVLEAEARFALEMADAWSDQGCLMVVLDAWKRAIDGTVVDVNAVDGCGAEFAGFLRASLGVSVWRDAVVVMAAAGVESATRGAAVFGLFTEASGNDPREGPPSFSVPDFVCADVDPEDAPADGGKTYDAPGGAGDIFTYGDVFLGMSPHIPDWPRVDALQTVLGKLCVDGEVGEAAAASLTLQGWISWCKGSGSYAHAFLQRARLALPGYRLAELLIDVMGQGKLCGWARRPESAWRGPKGLIT
ncbi:DUF4192 domain-containing protein [Paenarthrobacter sp. NPDC092416]|uniref:DUF4192 domain-containing protein n=1 Tax=Paenarthrobacter sp. NPDC092416 TaxID=3364386 RepID=UPI00381052A0